MLVGRVLGVLTRVSRFGLRLRKAGTQVAATVLLIVTIATVNVVVGTPLNTSIFSYDVPKMVLAYYEPWLEANGSAGRWSWAHGWNHWGWQIGVTHDPNVILPDGRRDVASVYYPLIGPYDSSSQDVLEYHIQLATASGIDAFILDWYGWQDWADFKYMDVVTEKVVGVSQRIGFTFALSYEVIIHFGTFAVRRSTRHLTRRELKPLKRLGRTLSTYSHTTRRARAI